MAIDLKSMARIPTKESKGQRGKDSEEIKGWRGMEGKDGKEIMARKGRLCEEGKDSHDM